MRSAAADVGARVGDVISGALRTYLRPVVDVPRSRDDARDDGEGKDPRHEAQRPRISPIAIGPAMKITAVCLVITARPAVRPASAETPGREKPLEASTPQTVAATIAASWGSSISTCISEMNIGVPRANTAANRPARRFPKASVPIP